MKHPKIYSASSTKDVAFINYLKNGKKCFQKITQKSFSWYFCVKIKEANKFPELMHDLKENGVVSNFATDGEYYKVFCHKEEWSTECASAVAQAEFKSVGVTLYEADLKLHERYIIDNNISLTKEHKIAHYDIETKDDKTGVVAGRDRIVSIAVTERSGKVHYFSDKSEYKLLSEALECMSNFTILTSWNGKDFDIAAIKIRCQEVGVKFTLWDVNHVDMFIWFKKAVEANMLDEKPKSYGLNAVCEQYLGITKTEGVVAGGGNIWNLFLNDPEKLKEYNIQDTFMLKAIDEKLMIVDQLINQSLISNAFVGGNSPLKQAIPTPSNIVDSYLLKTAHKYARRLPSKNFQAKKETTKRWFRRDKPYNIREKYNEVVVETKERLKMLKLLKFKKKEIEAFEERVTSSGLDFNVAQDLLDLMVDSSGEEATNTLITAALKKFPNEKEDVREDVELKYTGGLCYMKRAGIFDKVVSWDFKGYYNSLMRTFNFGTDTLMLYKDLEAVPMNDRKNIPVVLSPYTWMNRVVLDKLMLAFDEEGISHEKLRLETQGYNIPVYFDKHIFNMPKSEVKDFYIATEKRIDVLYKEYIRKFGMKKYSFSGYYFKLTKKKQKDGTYNVTIQAPFTSAYFRQDFDSIIRICLVEISELRDKWKKLKSDLEREDKKGTVEWMLCECVQLSYKLIGNLFYGQMGNIYFRVYNPVIAMSITLSGQITTQWSNGFFEKTGREAVYNDTDSNYIVDPNYTEEREEEFLKYFQKYYLKRMHKMCFRRFGVVAKDNQIFLEKEKVWFRIVYISKKYYVGYVEESDGKKCWKLVSRGIALRKTGTIKFVKDFQTAYYEMIFQKKIPDSKVFYDFITEAKSKFDNFKYDTAEEVEEVTKRMKVNKNIEEYKSSTPQVNLMIRCKESGMDIIKGDMVQYVYLKSSGKKKHAETAKNYLDNKDRMFIDTEHYWDNEIVTPIFFQLTSLFPDEQWGDFIGEHKTMREKKYKSTINRLAKKKLQEKLDTVKMISAYKRFSRKQRFELLDLAEERYEDEETLNAIKLVRKELTDDKFSGVEDIK